MLAQQLNHFKVWLQHHEKPAYRKLFLILKASRACDIPTPKLFNRFIGVAYSTCTSIWGNLLRVSVHTPAFKGRLSKYGRGLYLFGGVPFVSGPLSISLGDDCRISGQTTFSARPQSESPQPLAFRQSVRISELLTAYWKSDGPFQARTLNLIGHQNERKPSFLWIWFLFLSSVRGFFFVQFIFPLNGLLSFVRLVFPLNRSLSLDRAFCLFVGLVV